MSDTRSISWTRLDLPGTDMCEMRREEEGWILSGRSESRMAADGYALDYRVRCDGDWRTRRAEVTGQAGGRPIRFVLEQDTDGAWIVNGTPMPSLDGGRDIDLGFTPATNTIAIRRLSLSPGGGAPSRAVWLDEGDWQVKPLKQIYRRTGNETYLYLSPDNGFEAELTVDAAGFVRTYPGLWCAGE